MNKIVLKKSSVTGKIPQSGDLDYGELAVNYSDGKLYFKKSDNSIDYFTSASASVAGVASVDGETGDVTASQLLIALKKVDGSTSGLDADLLDGYNSSTSDTASTVVVRDANKNIATTSIDFTSTSGAQRVVWNSADGTFDLGLSNGVTLQAGQETHVYGKATEAIPNGALVMFAGSQGDHILISKANLNAVGFTDTWLVGVATQAFTTNQYGYVTWFGKVHDLNTSAWAEGTILYADKNTAGGLTSTKPTAPDHTIQIAAVLRSHATQGSILVRPTFGKHLDELNDVYISSVANNDVLVYNSSTHRWENKAVTSSSGVTSVDGNTGDITATQLLTAITSVDGDGSELDSDTLDGKHYQDIINDAAANAVAMAIAFGG